MGGTFDPLVGHVLDGRYEILAKLARGGMATVYRARDLRLQRTVAVKVMRSDLGEDDEFTAKFDREARAAATINHPAVVGVFDQGISDGQPYIVMEFIEGETLRRVISREAPLQPEHALELLEPIVAALACAHECGLVHRDIKPENVLISTRGQVKVADFGLARLITSPQMTATGVLVGTASYLPPELVTHSRPDSRGDVYSTGVVLFEMLTGHKPHTGENNYQIAYRHVNVDIEAPSERFEAAGHTMWHIPDYVDAFTQACTTRNPDSRFADGRAMLAALREVRAALARDQWADDPDLAAKLRPLPRDDGDLTQPIQPRPRQRPRPVTAAAGAATSPPSPERRPAAPVAASHSTPARTAQDSTTQWAPARRRPTGATQVRPRQPVGPHPEDSGRQPRIMRTPVFPIHVSQNPVHKRRRGAILLVLVLLLAVLAGLAAWWWASGRYTAVPEIGSVAESEARSIAEANDLRTETVTTFSEEVEAGLVIDSDPPSGERVLRGQTITVRVSQGPERFAMPTVVGTPLDAARAAIEGQHLVVGTVEEVWSPDVKEGLVTRASHDPGAKLKRDTLIDLEVSKGPEPVPIDDFTGRLADKAVASLEEVGFEVKVVEENSTSVKAGDVISQSPKSGSGHRGDTITLVKSLGPVMVDVPDVRYKGRDDAKKLLEDRGFVVEVKYITDFPLPLEMASGTEPGTGSKLAQGSKVILLVS